MGVGGFRVDPPAPAHAEMEDHRRPAIKVQQAIFGAPRKPGHLRPGHHLYQIGREGAAQVRAVELHAHDPLAFKEARKAANSGFNLGQFRHCKLRTWPLL